MGTLISIADLGQIESLSEQGSSAAIRRRAKLLLLYDQGLPTSHVAEQVGLSPSRTRYWRRRFVFEGMQIFAGSTIQIEESPPPEEAEPLDELESEQVEQGPISLDELRQRYPANLRQAEHRRDLALELFDATQTIHQLPDEQRRLLEVAALLQYLNESQEDVGASKAGHLFILSHPLIDLNDDENRILEDVLSYQHDEVDFNTAGDLEAPTPETKKEALVLAAILRISQGLDASQSQETNIQAIEVSPQGLNILVVGPYAKKDSRRAKKSAKLWSALFEQKVRLQAVAKIEGEDERLDILLAKTSPGVQADDPLAEAGRKVLGYHFAQMILHENGTRVGEDIEELHDMRVATRRMRSAFDVFSDAFDKKEVRNHLKGLRATGRALGRVRDLDVFMEKAQSYLEKLPQEERHGLDPLLSIWQKEREIERERMLAHLNSESYATFKRRFLDFLTAPDKGERKFGDTTPHLVRHVVPVLVYTRLAAVRAFSSILDSATIEQLHGLRIEFKKLRYTLEYFREVLGEGVKELIEEIKLMQDHLGDLNDADVACDILRQFLDDWESRQVYKPISQRDNPEPVVAYLAAKHAERYFLTTSFNEAWEKFERAEMRANMASAIAVL